MIYAWISCGFVLLTSLGYLPFPYQIDIGMALLSLFILTIGMLVNLIVAHNVRWFLSSPIQHLEQGQHLIIVMSILNLLFIAVCWGDSPLSKMIGYAHIAAAIVAAWCVPKWGQLELSVSCDNCNGPIHLNPFKWFVVLGLIRHARLSCIWCRGGTT